MDELAKFKTGQRQAWASFSTTASRLVGFASVQASQKVLDVGCSTGVGTITAGRLGAKVTGLDLTPELLERVRRNAAIAKLDIEWHEGDVESLPFGD